MTALPARREDETPHVTDLDADTLAKLVASGDCAKLTPEQRVAYYRIRCEAAGLDYRTQPFEFITLNGKLVLYARKEASAQLNRKHQLSHEVLREAVEQDVYSVWARAKGPDGRFTDELGAVSVKNLGGENLCNAKMKAVTKAKRRATLSYCGLGELDESELETIPARAFAGGEGAPPALIPPRRKSETKLEADALRAAVDRMDTSVKAEPAEIVGEEEPHDAMTRTLTQDEIGSLMGLVAQSKRSVPEFNAFLKTTFKIKSRKELQFGWLPEISTWLAAGE